MMVSSLTRPLLGCVALATFATFATLAVLACPTCAGGEGAWTIDLPVSANGERAFALPDALLSDDQELVFSYQRSETTAVRDVWIELSLLTSDGRYFATSQPLTIPGDNHEGELRIPLAAGHWSGQDGELGGDALAAVRELRLRLHGASDTDGRLNGTLRLAPLGHRLPLVLQLFDSGLVGYGPWRELRLRLLGTGGERGEVELALPSASGAGRHLPLFFDQPGAVRDGRWHACGPGRWVLRLATNEVVPAGSTVVWRAGSRSWTSAALPALSTVARSEALAPSPPDALPIPQAPAWSGFPCQVAAGGAAQRLDRTELVACPAPVLAWQSSWSGFRGAGAISYGQALAFDQQLAGGCADLDLLPQNLFREQGPFRFSLAPWHKDQGGPWEVPQDALRSDLPWQQWRGHVREVLARARATPGLVRWRLGLVQPANAPDEVTRLRTLLGDLSSLVGAFDARPVLALHPQAPKFLFPEPAGAWFDFEEGAQGWTYGPLPFSGRPQPAPFAAEGKLSLKLDFPVVTLGDGTRAIGVMREIDATLFNLDRLEFDAALEGGGTAQLYCWVTDNYHHWYQQRLDAIDGNRRWNTVGVDFSDHGAWQAVGGAPPWSAECRRRVRRLGIVAFRHEAGAAAGAGAAPSSPVLPAASTSAPAAPAPRVSATPATPATPVATAAAIRPAPAAQAPAASAAPVAAALYIDRMRRFGWAVEAAPTLTLRDLTVADGPVACWQPVQADFRLSIEAKNPYDPESADVVGEVVAPDGKKVIYPAYWGEPVRLEMADGVEHAIASGGGSWHWRFSPSAPGAWRWRLHARIKYRDSWLEANGDWRTLTVGAPSTDAMPPVRVSAKDHTSFETADGRWFYPIGINLRSPGDSRQDHVLAELESQLPHAPQSSGLFRSAAYERLGTRAYDAWLATMEKQHMNWARVWMCPWWCGLEWRRDWDGFGGLTIYNQIAAARLDRIMELARSHHIYVQLELQNHGMTSSHVDMQWADNPYNAINRGPCHSDSEFFSSEEAWATHAKRLRYTVARWGWHSHLAAWVLSSEMEFTGAWWEEAGNAEDGTSPTTEAWVKRSLAWFAANDQVAGRPVTIHFSHPWQGAQLWKMPGLGFSNSNAYTGFQTLGRLGGEKAGQGNAILLYLSQHFPPWTLNRPTLIGEWGGHWETNPSAILSAELHTGVWLQAVLPYSGNTGFWWWLWADAAGRWSDYAPIAAFVAGEDRRGLEFRPYRPPVFADRQHTAAVIGMKCETEHRYYAGLPGLSHDLTLTSQEDAGVASIGTDQAESAWHIERWDCAKGVVAAVFDLTADAHGVVKLPLGVLNPDAAFKMRRTAGSAH